MSVGSFGVDFPAEPTKFVKFPGWNSPVGTISADGYYIGGELNGKVATFTTKKHAGEMAVACGFGRSNVCKVHNRFFCLWAICDGAFGLVSKEWYDARKAA